MSPNNYIQREQFFRMNRNISKTNSPEKCKIKEIDDQTNVKTKHNLEDVEFSYELAKRFKQEKCLSLPLKLKIRNKKL